MANARNKSVDKTFLSIEQAEERGFIHRDYIAHCLRWSHVIKKMYERGNWKTARILDVGCGRELPFMKTMYTARLIPEFYMGVDVGPVLDKAVDMVNAGKMADRTSIWENTNLLELDIYEKFTHIICFEVLEHVEPKMMLDMLDKMKTMLAPGGRMFISTPCWDRNNCAANHVNEMTYEALGSVFGESGLEVVNVHGTFASIRDYVGQLSPAYAEVFQDLRDYYDVNFLSVILAPMFPAQSRNCLWELVNASESTTKMFGPITEQERPWGSSELWEDMQRE